MYGFGLIDEEGFSLVDEDGISNNGKKKNLESPKKLRKSVGYFIHAKCIIDSERGQESYDHLLKVDKLRTERLRLDDLRYKLLREISPNEKAGTYSNSDLRKRVVTERDVVEAIVNIEILLGLVKFGDELKFGDERKDPCNEILEFPPEWRNSDDNSCSFSNYKINYKIKSTLSQSCTCKELKEILKECYPSELLAKIKDEVKYKPSGPKTIDIDLRKIKKLRGSQKEFEKDYVSLVVVDSFKTIDLLLSKKDDEVKLLLTDDKVEKYLKGRIEKVYAKFDEEIPNDCRALVRGAIEPDLLGRSEQYHHLQFEIIKERQRTNSIRQCSRVSQFFEAAAYCANNGNIDRTLYYFGVMSHYFTDALILHNDEGDQHPKLDDKLFFQLEEFDYNSLSYMELSEDELKKKLSEFFERTQKKENSLRGVVDPGKNEFNILSGQAFDDNIKTLYYIACYLIKLSSDSSEINTKKEKKENTGLVNRSVKTLRRLWSLLWKLPVEKNKDKIAMVWYTDCCLPRIIDQKLVSGKKTDGAENGSEPPVPPIDPPDDDIVLKVNGCSYKFCRCQPGEFVMGSPESEHGIDVYLKDEKQHNVELTRGFWILETPVTQRLWEDVMGVKLAESDFNVGFGPDYPMYNVNWFDSEKFCGRLGEILKRSVRLPTEAEWEYACRAGTTTPFSFGETLNGDKANCNGKSPYGLNKEGKFLQRTAKVKSFSPNAWGLYDMHGNISEWCSDWYTPEYYFSQEAKTDPVGPASGLGRVFRGGNWNNIAWRCRSGYRSWLEPNYRTRFVGFRVVLVEE